MEKIIFGLIFGVGLVTGLRAAEPLKGNATRLSPQDLVVTSLAPDHTVSTPRYYTYEQLSSLPQITVKTKQDPNTHKTATYTGVLVSDLFAALGATPEQTVMSMTCYDKYQQYFDQDYNTKHKPILLLKFDGKAPAAWPKTEQNTPQGPYSVVYEDFVPAQTIYGYVEQPRIPFGVVSAQLSTSKQVFGVFNPKKNLSDPEIAKGQQIAMGSCISCHNIGSSGGGLAQRPWSILAIEASTNGDYFRDYVVNPQKFNPKTVMPGHPTFDAQTLGALQAYFKAMAPDDN